MNRLASLTGVITFTGLALTAQAQDDKSWSIFASLRGFYDDNYVTAPDVPPPGAAQKRDSYGFSLSPGISYTGDYEQTQLEGSYVYDMRWYEDRTKNSADHSHDFSAKLSHAFSPRYKITAKESFAIAQESSLLDPTAAPLRSNGTNMRNTAGLSFEAGLTRLLSTVISYSNTFYDYEQTGPASRSALMDRMEHLASVNLQWQALPTTVALVGYQYGIVDQTSKDLIAPGTPASSRDSRSHYGYLGVDHFFTADLSVSLRAGAQFTEFPNAPAGTQDNVAGPYVDFSGKYTISKGSSIQLGVKHTRVQTDIIALDQETTTAYGNINYRFTPKITGSVVGQYQTGSFNQGAFNNQSEQFFIVGVNLAYEINRHLTAEAGYNYDQLTSDLANRDFTRNRVYIGIKATY
ncbi:MAG TPA: outer membrane beta-barrel protein [Roseimicrobium sp.]|nr:outer membrane beta-barrel protein [Roseimicrobium sp.]